MAAHYDTAILPARPRRPRDKAKVEAAVLIVERWLLGRLRHRRFYSLGRYRMGQERRHFTEEFKREAIALLAGSGRPLIQIAGELGISPSMLRNWRHRQAGQNAGSAVPAKPVSAPPSVLDPAAEISRLRRE